MKTTKVNSLYAAVAVCGLTLLALLAAPAQVQADEHIWSALVLANKVDKPKPAPAELAKLGPKIEQIFGCNQLELVGSATKTIDEETGALAGAYAKLLALREVETQRRRHRLHARSFHLPGQNAALCRRRPSSARTVLCSSKVPCMRAGSW